MIAAAIALVVNFPNPHDQSERVKAHASSIVAVVAMVFAAAVLVGVLEGTGMVTAMADAIVNVVPPGLGPWFAVITGLLSMPFTFFMSNDAFYFGVLPILSEAAGQYGITPVEMAQASIVGQPVHLTSPLVPAMLLLISLGQGRPRRLPQEGHLASRRLLTRHARRRHRRSASSPSADRDHHERRSVPSPAPMTIKTTMCIGSASVTTHRYCVIISLVSRPRLDAKQEADARIENPPPQLFRMSFNSCGSHRACPAAAQRFPLDQQRE